MHSYNEQREKYYEEAVRLYYEDGLCYKAISRIIPPSHTTIKRWIVNFASENGISLSDRINMSKVKTKTQQVVETLSMEAELKKLKAENVRLESALRKAEIKANLYNEMIDVAEKMFDIPIRKKAGAKQ